MPRVYGKSKHAAAQDISKSGISLVATLKDSYHIANICYEYWHKTDPRINQFMRLVNEIGCFAAYLDMPVRYHSKLLTTVQDYKASQEVQVWKKSKKRHKITLNLPSTKRDRRKTLRATFANFIHQSFALYCLYGYFQMCSSTCGLFRQFTIALLHLLFLRNLRPLFYF